MTTIKVTCPRCKKAVEIEPEQRMKIIINAGHGRVMDRFGNPSLIQCACGKHIDA